MPSDTLLEKTDFPFPNRYQLHITSRLDFVCRHPPLGTGAFVLFEPVQDLCKLLQSP